jgi:hypothetical protein
LLWAWGKVNPETIHLPRAETKPTDKGWLADDNLEFILNALTQQNQSQRNWKVRTDIANIYNAFYKAATEQDWDLEEFTQELEADQHKYIIFPLRVSGNHWGMFILEAVNTNQDKVYYWNAKELTTLINKCLGNGSYSKEGLEAKIKSISDPNFFS